MGDAKPTAYRATLVREHERGKDITKGPRRTVMIVAVTFAEAAQKADTQFPDWELVGLYKTKEEVIQ